MTIVARIKIALVTLLVLALTACYQFPPPEVVKQADPSPLRGAKSFVVAPITFDGFTYEGQPEAEWFKTRSEKQVSSWQNDKREMTGKVLKWFERQKSDEQSFVEGSKAGDGQFLVAINFDRYDGQMRWTAEIRDASGGVVDIVRDPKAFTATFNTWMAINSGAQISTMMIAKYLHSRAFPEPKLAGGAIGREAVARANSVRKPVASHPTALAPRL